jgi:tetratricopeptide (TPR) repeat protein
MSHAVFFSRSGSCFCRAFFIRVAVRSMLCIKMMARWTLLFFFLGTPLADRASVHADIISPTPTPRTNSPAPGIPDTLLIELDAADVSQLNEPVAKFLADRDLAAFLASYESIQERTDKLPAAEVFLGKLFLAYNLANEVATILETYINKNPEDPEAYIALGNLALRSGRVIDAWLNLQHAETLINNDKLGSGRKALVMPVLVELQASTAERRKYWDEAVKLFSQLARLKPELNYPMWRAGRIRVMAGQIDLGYELMQRAYQKDSQLPPPAISVAQTLHDTTDWINTPEMSAQVERWYQRAVSENPEYPGGWSSYFKWLILSNRPKDVAEKHASLPSQVTSDREIQLMHGLSARYLDDFDTAEQIFSAANQANPQDIEIADQLALVLIESSDEAKRGRALQLAERNLRQLPQAEVTMATAAWIQLKLGAVDVADNILGQLAARGNLSPQTAFYIAELMNQSGQPEEARQLLAVAVDSPGIFPQRSQVKRRLSPPSP